VIICAAAIQQTEALKWVISRHAFEGYAMDVKIDLGSLGGGRL
jgi:hypothetical protein